MNYATQLFEVLCKAIGRPNRRKLRRMEKKLQRKVDAELEKEKKSIISKSKKLLKKSKELNGKDKKAIEAILASIVSKKMIKSILSDAGDSMDFGANYRIDQHTLGEFGISFDLKHPLAVKYLKTDRPLILANIPETTKDLIRPLLIEAVETGMAPQKLAGLISENFAFSKNRSLMIAVHEVGKAYEVGNIAPMLDAKAQGLEAVKQWLTVGDSKVTETHKQNQNDGWIDVEDTFSGTGDTEAPASDNPNCRCTTLFDIL
jgi:hypothetical protein